MTMSFAVTYLWVQGHVGHGPPAVVQLDIKLLETQLLLQELAQVALQQVPADLLLQKVRPWQVPRHHVGQDPRARHKRSSKTKDTSQHGVRDERATQMREKLKNVENTQQPTKNLKNKWPVRDEAG